MSVHGRSRRMGAILSDLRMLRCFVAVAEESHVGRAADRLSMQQSSVSRAIKQLEANLGCQLLVHRRGRSGDLTEAGEITLAIGKEILTLYEALAHRVAECSQGS